MNTIFKTAVLSILAYLIYTYVVLPVSLPERENFLRSSGTVLHI